MSGAAARVEPRLVHRTPGRARVHLAGWSGAEQDVLEARLLREPGVRAAQANPLTSNVLVHFDPALTDEGRVLAALGAVGSAGARLISRRPRCLRAPSRRSPRTQLGVNGAPRTRAGGAAHPVGAVAGPTGLHTAESPRHALFPPRVRGVSRPDDQRLRACQPARRVAAAISARGRWQP